MMQHMDNPPGKTIRKSQLGNPFISLRHAQFRLYIAGMAVSMIGTWMQNIAQPWLAFTITQSPFMLSLVTSLQLLPVLLLSLFAGVIIDHYPRKSILLLTQTAATIITLILAVLAYTGSVQFWHILVLSTLLGVVNSIDIPARAAFVNDLVDREDLMNAVALNSTIFNTARIVGPALAGVIMGLFGAAICFLLNSISFAAVIVCLMFIRPKSPAPIHKRDTRVLADIWDGLSHIIHTRTLSTTLAMTAIVVTFTMNFSVLIPVFATRILNEQETGFGFLMSFMGIGSLSGALFVAMTCQRGPSRFVLNVMPFFSAGLLVLTALSRQYFLTGLLLALTGLCIVSFTSTTNSIMQIHAEDAYRGRVMSVYNLVFNGCALVGNLLSGYISDHYGPEYGFAACGALLALLLAAATVIKSAQSSASA